MRELLFRSTGYDIEEDDEYWSSVWDLCDNSSWPLDLFLGRYVAITEGAHIGRVARVASVIDDTFLLLDLYPDGERARECARDVREVSDPSSTRQWEGMLLEKQVIDEMRLDERS